MWVQMEAWPLAAAAPRPAIAPLMGGLTAEIASQIIASSETARACAIRLNVCHRTVQRIRAGQQKPRQYVRLSDETVDEMRVRHEDAGWSYREIARFYSLPLGTVRTICAYRRR